MECSFALILLIATFGQAEADARSRYIDRIRTLVARNEYEKALTAVDEIPSELRQELKASFQKGYFLYKLGLHRQAVEAFKASESQNENASPLRSYLHGICALEVEQYRESLQKFTEYVASPDDGQDQDRRVADAIRLSEKGRDGALSFLQTPEAQELTCGTSVLWRGILAYEAEDLDAAERLVGAFLESKPRHERALFWRCKIRQKRGREADAISDYATLLRINPAHGGGFDEAKARRQIEAPGNIMYGRWQTEKMLADRPRMGERFDPANPLHVWVAIAFQRMPEDRSILWDAEFRRTDASAYSGYATAMPCWAIHVSNVHQIGKQKGKEMSADDLWSSALFELENLRNRPAFSATHNQARREEISRRDFSLALAQLEWGAGLRTRAFFTLVYFPWATEHGLVPSFAPWFEPSLTFDDRKASFADDDYYPWKIYGKQYDSLRRLGKKHHPN